MILTGPLDGDTFLLPAAQDLQKLNGVHLGAGEIAVGGGQYAVLQAISWKIDIGPNNDPTHCLIHLSVTKNNREVLVWTAQAGGIDGGITSQMKWGFKNEWPNMQIDGPAFIQLYGVNPGPDPITMFLSAVWKTNF